MKLFKLAPAFLAIVLMGCTITATSPLLGSGGLISIGGGTPPAVTPAGTPPAVTPPGATPVVTPAPVPVAEAPHLIISRLEAGKIEGPDHLDNVRGVRYAWAKDGSGNLMLAVNPDTKAVGALFTVDGSISQGEYSTKLTLHPNGEIYHTTYDGVTRVFTHGDMPNGGTAAVQIPPLPTADAGTGSAPASSVASDPVPTVVPGSSGKIIKASVGGLGAALASAAAGDTVQAAPGVYNESVGITVATLVDGGGTITNPGDKSAAFKAGAILDATGVASYREGQGGFVLLGDAVLRGWEIKGFGYDYPGHDGTAGIRNNRDGTFRIEDCYLHHNQMGIGPHVGGNSLMRVKNCLFLNNSLPQDPGYAHNIYSYATHLIIEGGVTSIVDPGKGDGHALKFGGAALEVYGKNYFRSPNTSCIDIPHGTAKPFIISADANGGTTVEKLDGDDNHVLLGYGVESRNNGNAGGSITGATFIVPNNGQNYMFLTSGPITITNCKFLYTDGSPVKSGTIIVQGGGIVTGLPA